MNVNEMMELIDFRRMQREASMRISLGLRKQRQKERDQEISRFIQDEFK